MIDFLKKYLILETIEQQISDAIDNHQVLYMNYKGNKEGNVLKNKTIQGQRLILPVALGINKRGNMVVRGYLTSVGVETPWRMHTTKTPNTYDPDRWKTFRLDRITSVIPREGKRDFWATPPPDFNPNGDRSMIQVLKLAKFGGEELQPDKINPTISVQPEPEKQSVEPVSKIDKIPTGQKVVLKPAEKQPPIKEPVQPPKAKQTFQATPEVPPEPTEEPETDYNQPKPISEWYLWLHKILND